MIHIFKTCRVAHFCTNFPFYTQLAPGRIALYRVGHTRDTEELSSPKKNTAFNCLFTFQYEK